MKRQSVCVIVVNWNGKEYTSECLKSLRNLYQNGDRIRIIVVDNNSTDGSVNYIEKNFPEVDLIRLKTNTGFTGANNIAANKAVRTGFEYLWILNNDTVVDQDALSALTVFKNDKIGAASSKIYFAPGAEYHKDRYQKHDLGRVIWYAGGVIDWDNIYAYHRGVDEVDRGQYEKIEDTDFLTGCSLFIRSNSVKSVGLFDERYFAYLEDVDLSVRLQKHGLLTVYFPSSKVWHANAASSGGSGSQVHQYYQTRNRFLFGMTHATLRTKIALVRQAVWGILKNQRSERMAYTDALLGQFGPKI